MKNMEKKDEQGRLFSKEDSYETEGEIMAIVDRSAKDYILKSIVVKTPEGQASFGYFKDTNLKEGDNIKFKYIKKGMYNNIVELYGIKDTHPVPTEIDKLNLEDEQSEYKISDYVQLLNNAIRICVNRNTLSDEEIKAQFERLIQLGGLEEWVVQLKKKLKP